VIIAIAIGEITLITHLKSRKDIRWRQAGSPRERHSFWSRVQTEERFALRRKLGRLTRPTRKKKKKKTQKKKEKKLRKRKKIEKKSNALSRRSRIQISRSRLTTQQRQSNNRTALAASFIEQFLVRVSLCV